MGAWWGTLASFGQGYVADPLETLAYITGAPNGNFRESICSEDDLRSRIFGAFVVEFSGAFFLAEIFEKVSFVPYNFRITRLSVRKSEQMKNL